MNPESTQMIQQTYSQLYKSLKEAAEQLELEFKGCDDRSLLSSRKVTNFILVWMREYYLFQKKFDALFNRSVMQPAADQFTAVVALALQKYLSARQSIGSVKSETNLERRKGSLRPDISIWQSIGELVGVVECKTNLGRNRYGWKKQYEDRTKRISTLSSHCLSFLCVLTKENWEVSWEEFSGSPLAGKKWLCLSDLWPSKMGRNVSSSIIHPVEPMFITIKEALEAKR